MLVVSQMVTAASQCVALFGVNSLNDLFLKMKGVLLLYR